MIDWTRLRPYRTSKNKSLEQLCYQIAVYLYSENGRITAIDDSGGGDGVEFYLTLPDGQDWGWQAKYYEGEKRLSVSNRKEKIKKSLLRALDKHPNLSTWHLCQNSDLTPDEQHWFDYELPQAIPKTRIVQLVFWGDSYLHAQINKPGLNGLKQAFFNELELSIEWFRNTNDKTFNIVKNKYDDLLYTSNEEFEYWYVNPLLCNEKFRENRIDFFVRDLKDKFLKAKKELLDLNYTTENIRPLFAEYIAHCSQLILLIEKLLLDVTQRLGDLNPNSIFTIKDQFFLAESESIRTTVEKLKETRITWRNTHPSNGQGKNYDSENFRKLFTLEGTFEDFLRDLRDFVSHSRLPLKMRTAHFTGNGGDGKTNFCIALAKQYLKDDFPAIYIAAISFTSSSPLSEQILSLLDIKTGYSFSDLLDCLNEMGSIFNKRIPIIIDGLNEALNSSGRLNERLELDLPTLENEILRRKNLVFITTCRRSYKQRIWGNVAHEDYRFHSISGFNNFEDRKQLVRNYFRHYKIQADISFLTLIQFSKPLYLKIFCESTNPDRLQVVHTTIGYDSIYSIFDRFVDFCNANIYTRLTKYGDLPPLASHKRLATDSTARIAEYLWTSPKREYLLNDLYTYLDSEQYNNYSHSKTKALLDEELLFIRNWNGEDEYVHFTYDMMAGYFIAQYLIDTVVDFSTFLSSKDSTKLIGSNIDDVHPNCEDILDALSTMLPIKKSVFIHDLLISEELNLSPQKNSLIEKSISATVLLPQRYIPSSQITLIKQLSYNPDELGNLLRRCQTVFFVDAHPFNFSFWDIRLRDMEMNERDLSWAEYLRALDSKILDDLLNEYEELQTGATLTNEQLAKVCLVNKFIKWAFASTNNLTKQNCANALYRFAIKYPAIFLVDYYDAATINDPTIFEWMSIVLYNALTFIFKQKDRNIEGGEADKLADYINNELLSPGGVVSSNHLIVRSYSYNILRLLTRKVPTIAKKIDLKKIREGYDKLGITEWQEQPDLNENEYSDGNSLIDYFFNKEKMPYVVVGEGDEYHPSPEYLTVHARLRWRAYELGYKFDRFGEIDKEIASLKRYSDSNKATNRYADKYIEIAFLEYCGYLEGKGQFDDNSELGYLRPFELKHDSENVPICNNDSSDLANPVSKSLVDSSTPPEIWTSDDSIPDIANLLSREELKGMPHKWILLNGLIHQVHLTSEKQIYCRLETIFVKNLQVKSAQRALTEKTKLGWGGTNILSTGHIHDSEIPDADTIPYNQFVDWTYSLTSKKIKRTYTRLALFRKGERLSEKIADQIWKEVCNKTHHIGYERVSRTDFAKYSFWFPKHPDDVCVSPEEALSDMNIEILEEQFSKIVLEPVERTIQIFVPVRSFNGMILLCKNMIDNLSLTRSADSYDLFDQSGQLASSRQSYTDRDIKSERFTYLRKDLLDKYLLQNNLTMFQIIAGERDFHPADGHWENLSSQLRQRKHSKFYQAYQYKLTS